VYADELEGKGMHILGLNINLDPLALCAIGFGLILFNFTVLTGLGGGL
jgi:hypothetical protein